MTESVKKRSIIIGIILGVIFLISGFVGIYSYFLEVKELGKEFISVFFTNLKAGVISAVFIFLFTFGFTVLWNYFISKNISRVTLKDSLFEKKLFVMGTAGIIALIVTFLTVAPIYKNLLSAINYVPFGVKDPIFGMDMSYYMLVRPLLLSIKSFLNTVFILLFIYSVVVYYLYCIREHRDLNFKNILEYNGIVKHLLVNIAVIFLIKTFSYRFTMEELLFSKGGRVGGGYTEMNVWLTFYKIVPFILLAVIIFSLVFLFKSKYKAMILTIAVYPLSFIAAAIIALVMQQVFVKPNEGSKESVYIQYNIDNTRLAYNLADVSEQEYVLDDNLNAKNIDENREIIDNIRITDHGATITAFNQLQGLRNYYQFLDADVVPYTENEQRKAAFISARELSQADEMDNATYVNRRMKYTHGYGIVKSPVNKVTKEGQPDFLTYNMPLNYKDTDIKISQPRIYFGEAADDYYIVNTTQAEIDFSENASEDEYHYDGSAGIPLTPLNRFVYAIKNTDLNLITSGYINSDSKLLVNHNVIERLEKAAPFISFDSDIHITVDKEGNLKWIVDGYTTSSFFPYSQYTGDSFNYIRNSVKAVVDAYDGEISLYIIDNKDPIIQSYAKIYPKVFEERPFPEDLQSQIKYPEWLFKVQANIFTKYHVTNPSTFYSGSDVWAIAREKYGESAEIKDVEPYYNITVLDDGTPEFIIMLPYTLRNKDNNLVGWLGARTDNGNYGKFVAYSFPVGKHAYGTMQIENKIDNDPEISKEMTLWSQGGSSVMRGNMLVIPLKNSLIYVEPLYITSQNEASLPEVKRIIVAYEDKIVMEDSLDSAFVKLFGEAVIIPDDPTTSEEPTPPGTEEPIIPTDPDTLSLVKEEYKILKQAAADGDWEAFGKSMDKIDELLQ